MSLLVLGSLFGARLWIAAYPAAPRTVPPATPLAHPAPPPQVEITATGATRTQPLAPRLALLASEPAGAARSAHLAALIDSCPEAEMPDLARAILDLDDPAFAAEAAQAFFGSWAVSHTDTLIDWLRTQSGAERSAWAGVLADALAAKPNLLLAVINRLVTAEPADADGMLSPVATALDSAGQFAAASTLIERIQNGALRASLRHQLVAGWATNDPAAAGAWLSALPADEERDALYGELAELWSAKQPRAAATWAFARSASLGRTHALTIAIEAWATQDAAATAEWLAQQSLEADLDTPIFSLATRSSLARSQPAIAAAWAERIVNPDVRFEGIRTIVRIWADTDRAAARQFVEHTAVLDATFRQILLDELGS